MAATRGFFRFVRNALMAMFGFVLLVGLIAYSEGAVMVDVRDKAPDSEHFYHRIWLPVPALAVSEGLRFVPDRDLADAMRQARPWLPAIRVAASELGKTPDGILVEVRDHHDHVVIRKEGGYVLVDVDSDDATVHVAVPLTTVQAVAERLGRSEAAAGSV